MSFVKDGVCHIPLQKSKGRDRMFAIIDEDDHDRVACFKWFAVASGKTFYARITSGIVAAHLQAMHSFVMKVPHGVRVDHINGNGLDNRRTNLRAATAAENSRNTYKQTTPCSSKFKGVVLTSSGRWAASISFDGKHEVIGFFDDEDSAARSYDQRALALFGQFAKTNEMMGLFENGKPIRAKDGLRVTSTKLLGSFKGAPTGKIFAECERVGDRASCGLVVGLAKNIRTHEIVYRLDTGHNVAVKSFLGRHPTEDEMSVMRANMRRKSQAS